MSRLTEKTVDAGEFGIKNLTEETPIESLWIFDETETIFNLETDAETKRPLRLKFNLDQLEEYE